MAIITHPKHGKKTVALHRPLTLRGDKLEIGIPITEGHVRFAPQWGMTRSSRELLAPVKARRQPRQYNLELPCAVVIAAHGPVLVLVSGDEQPERELVLVQEYETGSGAKRWPGFKVKLNNRVKELVSANTNGGSGWEKWTLISAPIGWAADIAAQFNNARDVRSQTISSRP